MNARSDRWHRQPLPEERILILSVTAVAMRVRLDRQVGSVPGLAAHGVRADGQTGMAGLDTLLGESTTAWCGFVARGLARPHRSVSSTVARGCGPRWNPVG